MISPLVYRSQSSKIISNHKQHTFMNTFVKRRLVSAYHKRPGVYLLRIHTDDTPHTYFFNFLEIVLITILKLSYTKIVRFNTSSRLLHFYTLFILPSRHMFLVYLDVIEAMPSLKVFGFCTWTFLYYYGLMMDQAWVETNSRLVCIFVKMCWLWLEILSSLRYCCSYHVFQQRNLHEQCNYGTSIIVIIRKYS